MDFTQKILERNCLEKVKEEGNPASIPERVQQGIKTKIYSTNDSVQRNSRITVARTATGKLPPLSPSHATIEVVSDGTSTDTGSESPDNKENEHMEHHQYFPSQLQHSKATYIDDSDMRAAQKTKDVFALKEPKVNSTVNLNKPAGRKARLAALASTINNWEDDVRHFTVAKQCDTKVSNKSSVFTKHAVMKDKENSAHRKFVSVPKKGIVFGKTTEHSSATVQKAHTISRKRSESSMETALEPKRALIVGDTKDNTKSMVWDKTVLDSLEAQGFSRSISKQRLIYNYNEEENLPSPVRALSPTKAASSDKPQPSVTRLKTSPVKNMSPVKTRFDSHLRTGKATTVTSTKVQSESAFDEKAVLMRSKPIQSHSGQSSRDKSPTKVRDPAELSVAERMALFERNAGPAVMPRPLFGASLSCSQLPKKTMKTCQQLSSGSLHERVALFEARPHENQCTKEAVNERQREELRQRCNLNKEHSTTVKEDLKTPTPPSPPPLPSPPEPFEFGRTSGRGYSCYNEEEQSASPERVNPQRHKSKELRKVRFSSTNLECSYIDQPNSDMEDDLEEGYKNRSSLSTSSNDSDVGSSRKEYLNISSSSLKRDWSTSESSGADANEVDEFLEEALDNDLSDVSQPKRLSYSKTKNEEESFYRECHSTKREQSQSSSPPLLHTVSFYRKQQNKVQTITLHQRMEIKPTYSEESIVCVDHTDDEMDDKQVKEKVEQLEQEVAKQQSYISQASQALDLCYSSFEFSGSTELLEAEKLLLLASLRKQALLQEMQRLEGEGRLDLGETVSERGSLTISLVSLPLKMDVVHDAAKYDECYYLLCVVRHKEEVLSSDIMSARRSLHSGNVITFPSKFVVRDLDNDFKIIIEVFAMKARHKELIPHDIKYHINTNKKEVSKLRLTPRKTKPDKRMITVSPTRGRSTAFTMAGHLVLSLRDVHRRQFTLCKNKNTYNNVVEGSLQLQLDSEMRVDVEYRGFLTMFEDVSGLGAWHRRWCLLKGDKLSYWRYPDDEHKKFPLDTIELSQCTIKQVEVVRRDVCARPNTLELYTVRPARPTDIESLVVTTRRDRTCVRHWLSADTKEERDQWCHHLNKALSLMRAWGTSTTF